MRVTSTSHTVSAGKGGWLPNPTNFLLYCSICTFPLRVVGSGIQFDVSKPTLGGSSTRRLSPFPMPTRTYSMPTGTSCLPNTTRTLSNPKSDSCRPPNCTFSNPNPLEYMYCPDAVEMEYARSTFDPSFTLSDDGDVGGCSRRYRTPSGRRNIGLRRSSSSNRRSPSSLHVSMSAHLAWAGGGARIGWTVNRARAPETEADAFSRRLFRLSVRSSWERGTFASSTSG
mmetsp:Transcript_38360/g.81867  ORF Transcript_38360/g.81867 Transcript_38360/m.81867 type:complete len:227 (-) Transcript_38360:153-833(-)